MSDQNPGGRSSGIARHGKLPRSGPLGGILALVGTIIAVVVVSALAITGVTVYNVGKTVANNTQDIHPGESAAPPPGIGAYPGGFNILIVGDDTREGQDGIGAGADSGGALNDVTILLHVSGNHTSATAVSLPRDMVVPHPQCSKGGTAVGLPLNTALSYGGLPCVVSVVEAFTGLPIQFAGLITFTGVVDMSNAVGGVQVCVDGNLNDKEVGLHLTSGYHTLSGLQALEFLRSRHGVGDGSDLGRISSQQVYLSALVRKLEDQGTLSNPLTVYKLATAATEHMQLSTSLASTVTMYTIAQALKSIPLDRVNFVQYPGTTNGTGIYAGKVQPSLYAGNQLMTLLKEDKPFTLGETGGIGSVPDPHATKTPTATNAPTTTAPTAGNSPVVLQGVSGQSAAQQTCSKANTRNGQN